MEIDYKSSATATFELALQPITSNLRKQIGYNPDYIVVSLLIPFSNKRIYVAADAAFHRKESRPMKSGRFDRLAYHSIGCLDGKSLGRAPSKCNDYGPLNLVVVLDYESDYFGSSPLWCLAISKGYGERYYNVRPDFPAPSTSLHGPRNLVHCCTNKYR